MKAVEIESVTDLEGILSFQYDLAAKSRKVRVILLIEEEADDKDWLKSASANPAFDFLNEPEEDIYNENDGEPFHYKE